MTSDVFDLLEYLKRQGILIPTSYRLNPTFNKELILKKVNEVSGKTLTPTEFKRFLERHNVKFYLQQFEQS